MEDLPSSYRAGVIDGYGAKLMTSGYSLTVTRKILTNGIKGYLAKVGRRKISGGRIHRTSEESSGERRRKKLLGSSNWFRGRGNKIDGEHGATTVKGGGDLVIMWN